MRDNPLYFTSNKRNYGFVRLEGLKYIRRTTKCLLINKTTLELI